MKVSRSFAGAAMLLVGFTAFAKAAVDWTGPYIGANLGYGSGQTSTSFEGDADEVGIFGSGQGFPDEATDGVFNQSLHREIYGIQTGYNTEIWRNFFGGFEATYDLANIMAKSENNLPNITFPGVKRIYLTRVTALMSIAPQVGYAWDRVFMRVKAGLAAGRVFSGLNNETDLPPSALSFGPVSFGQERTHIGWTLGFGADYALTDHVFAGFQYDYYDLGRIHFGGLSVPDETFPLSYTVHPVLRTFSARVGYKF